MMSMSTLYVKRMTSGTNTSIILNVNPTFTNASSEVVEASQLSVVFPGAGQLILENTWAIEGSYGDI